MTFRTAFRFLSSTSFLALLLAAPGAADTGGRLAGAVRDASGAALPGVTVTATSEALIGGFRTSMTDEGGQYAFPLLAPGDYTVKAELEGFVPVEQPGVGVRLDRTAQVDFELGQGSVTEEITVTSEYPIIDPQQTTQGQVFQREYLDKATVGSGGRDYLDVIGQAAGVAGTGNVRVFGSTGAENSFLIDGLTTTDPVTSTFGVNFNFDAIQEISFLVGGFKAEYGGATGGVINLITKSGGNEFAGSVDVRYRETDFNENGDHFDKDDNTSKFIKPAATLGGPLMRDKVWFFASYEDIDSESTPTQSPTTRDFEGQNYIGKVTWRAAQNVEIVGKVSGDPADINNANAGRFRTADATRVQEQGGTIVSGALAWTVGSNSIFDAIVGVNRQELNSIPQSGDLNTPSIFNDTTGITSNNYENAQFSDRDRDELRANWTQALDLMGANHELKGGIEYNDLKFKSQNFTTGGASYQDRGTTPRLLFVTGIQDPLEFDGTRQGLYVQDSLRVGNRVSLDAGLRYDEIAFDNNEGTEIATLDKVQPRLGVAWDITGDSKTIARAYWGRFMHPNALTLPSHVRTVTVPTELYLSCSRFFGSRANCLAATGHVIDDPLHRDPNGFGLFDIFSSSPSTIFGDLDAMYADSWSIGVERQLGRHSSVEISYVKKETKDIFEDTCDGNQPVVGGSDSCDHYVFANLPGLSREYEGIIVRAESRFFDWAHLIASYTNSKSEGNIDDTQNAGIDFDVFPVHFTNTFGPMPDDRRHRIKLNGYADLPLDFVVGFDAFWSSDFAYDRVTNVDPYGTEFLEPRGSRRANENYQLDVDVRKGFRVGEDLRFEVIATVINVFGDEQVTAVCEDDLGCGGDIELGDATAFGQPRRYEAGFRFTFN